MVPACYFASQRQTRLPVRPFGSTTVAGSPRLRPLLRFWPVAVLSAASTCRYASVHSPLGFLGPSGSKRSTGFAAGEPAFRIRPITSRSPPPVFFKYGCGSSFLVRYVSGGLLFLKPLGTSFTMLPRGSPVNSFL